MKSIEILVEDINHKTHVAILENNKIIDLYSDSNHPEDVKWGSLYLARVKKIDTRLDVAFVDLGNGQEAMLPGKHVFSKNSDRTIARTNISCLLSAGQMITVQVKSEGYRSTNEESAKLPRVTMKLYISGRLLIYSPLLGKVTISQKIQREEVFETAKKLKGNGGWIIRSSAEYSKPSFLMDESEHLYDDWLKIERSVAEEGEIPRLLYSGLTAVCRALTDYSNNSSIDRIEVDHKSSALVEAQKWCEIHAPDYSEKLTICDSKDISLFDFRDALTEIDQLDDKCILLPNGGSIIIDQAHAFTVIDVNRGSAANVVSANMEAATEITRQLKIRNHSGAILIDFINMRLKTDRYKLVSHFERLLRTDPAHPQVLGFSRLGILEMIRKRRTAPYHEK